MFILKMKKKKTTNNKKYVKNKSIHNLNHKFCGFYLYFFFRFILLYISVYLEFLTDVLAYVNRTIKFSNCAELYCKKKKIYINIFYFFFALFAPFSNQTNEIYFLSNM